MWRQRAAHMNIFSVASIRRLQLWMRLTRTEDTQYVDICHVEVGALLASTRAGGFAVLVNQTRVVKIADVYRKKEGVIQTLGCSESLASVKKYRVEPGTIL